MAFQERFKGKTSVIDKEGITAMIKSKSQPIYKKDKDVNFELPPIEKPSEFKKNNKINEKKLDYPNRKLKIEPFHQDFALNSLQLDKLNSAEEKKNINNYVIKTKFHSQMNSPLKPPESPKNESVFFKKINNLDNS